MPWKTAGMAAHAMDYVRVRTAAGTLGRHLPDVEAALRRREAEGFRLQSTVAESHEGDLVGVLLFFVRDESG
jgi:hypothetical protein